MTSPSFPDLRAAAIDGRTHNIYYRQHQLEALHSALLSHAPSIRAAISADTTYTPAEIAVEFHLALSALKNAYETLQPAKAHADEYLIAGGCDAPNTKVPAGIAYIEPCAHTLFYSVIVPLGRAIAGGCCVIVLLENNLRTLTRVLRETLKGALHPDTFAIASSPVRDAALLKLAVHVDQNSSEDWPRGNQLASPSHSRAFAVVDRTSDIKLAARELVAARFTFDGTSPYAPDLVLVNEFVKQEFVQAVVEEGRKLTSTTKTYGEEKSSKPNRTSAALEALKKTDSNLQILVQESSTLVVELPTRSPTLLANKTSAPVLSIHTIKSLDDAIDFISSAGNSPALAAYHFGNQAVGKYLSQFVDARVSFVNHVPREMLIGPAHPSAYAVEPERRYTVEMFTFARPAFIQIRPSSGEIEAVMNSKDGEKVAKMLERAMAPLMEMKRKAGGGVGFFEQGFLMNAGMILTITVSATAAGTIWLVKNGRIPAWGFRV